MPAGRPLIGTERRITTSVKLDPAHLEWLDAAAERDEVSRSQKLYNILAKIIKGQEDYANRHRR